MKTIIFLNHVKATLLPDAPVPSWSSNNVPLNDLLMEIYPTKCKVTINGNIIIDDVYVYQMKAGEYGLYKDYAASVFQHSDYISGWSGSISTPVRERLTIYFWGKGLVLQFKSDNFIIEAV